MNICPCGGTVWSLINNFRVCVSSTLLLPYYEKFAQPEGPSLLENIYVQCVTFLRSYRCSFQVKYLLNYMLGNMIVFTVRLYGFPPKKKSPVFNTPLCERGSTDSIWMTEFSFLLPFFPPLHLTYINTRSGAGKCCLENYPTMRTLTLKV